MVQTKSAILPVFELSQPFEIRPSKVQILKVSGFWMVRFQIPIVLLSYLTIWIDSNIVWDFSWYVSDINIVLI